MGNSSLNLWAVMLGAGLATYAIRLSFIVLLGRKEISPGLIRVLRFVPPAVLSAIIFPEMLMPAGDLFVSIENSRLTAGLVAILVAWKTRSVLYTILTGMLALILWQALLGWFA
jgi:branched-subunit amino acid transport protein